MLMWLSSQTPLKTSSVAHCWALTHRLKTFDLESLRPVSVSGKVEDTTIGAEDFGFDYRAGQIKHYVTIGSPPQPRFCGAVLSRRVYNEDLILFFHN